jgi:hypothetical protein
MWELELERVTEYYGYSFFAEINPQWNNYFLLLPVFNFLIDDVRQYFYFDTARSLGQLVFSSTNLKTL